MDKYKLLLNSVTAVLKQKGYDKKGTTFYIFKDNNWGLLNFQKGRSSTKEAVLFTLNIGIVSSLLRQSIDRDYSTSKPEPGHYHWETRIGFLMSEKGDFWWRLDGSDDVENVIIYVISALNQLAIPTIDKHISDEGLINTWTNGGGGTSVINKYIYLTTLLKLKKDERLPDFVQEMLEVSRRKPIESFATEHARYLNSL